MKMGGTGMPPHPLVKMSDERSAKLKLKRKKCVTAAQVGQEVEVTLQPSSALGLRQDFTGSWFDEIELTAAEQIWKQVVSSAYPDPHSVDWHAVPSLPFVNLKMSRKEKEMINTEVFKVGNKNFEWVALPSFITTNNAEKPCVQEIEGSVEHINKSSPDIILEKQISNSRKPTVLLNEQVGLPVYSGERNAQDLPTPQDASTNFVMLPPMSQKSAKENPTKPQTLLKGSSKNILYPRTSQKSSTKRNKEQHQATQKTNLWTTVSSLKSNKIAQEPKTEAKPHFNVLLVDEETSEGSSKENTKKKSAKKAADVTNSFDNCPICLMSFPKQFSQLDMDSHLAQCLSETTVDVVW
ncbi:Fanconi anemia core complex-associated protein 20 isoform X2 [Dendrobates tinctorius]|uniref:Fanconi anemia core complex-associated protein 20 isoform X2 n=1 Tax=Dendrobates tinctorius TaxID=92724 RepID=UPI003CCA46F8